MTGVVTMLVRRNRQNVKILLCLKVKFLDLPPTLNSLQRIYRHHHHHHGPSNILSNVNNLETIRFNRIEGEETHSCLDSQFDIINHVIIVKYTKKMIDLFVSLIKCIILDFFG